MTQEQLKEQFFQYAMNNLHKEYILLAIIELLDNIGGDLYSNGCTSDANDLWTCQDIIKKVLDGCNYEETE